MIKKLVRISLAFSLMLIFSVCERPKTVARVGNYLIGLPALEQEIESARTATSLQEALNIVNRLAEDKLKLMEAHRCGFEQDSLVLARTSDAESREVLSYVIERDVIRKIVTNRMIKERYRLSLSEWQVRHIFIPLSQSEGALEQLSSLRARVLRGADFGALARDYSKDAKSAGKNGDLGFIRWDKEDWGEPFMQRVAALQPGQISKPFLSTKGFHLVKLEKIRTVGEQSFAEKKEEIERQLIRENAAKLDSAYFAYRDAMMKKYKGQMLKDKIDTVLVLIQATEQNNREEKVNLRRDPRQFMGFLSARERQLPLATFAGGEYTFTDLLTTYERISPMRRPALQDTAAVLEFLNRNVPRKIMLYHGYRNRVQHHPRVKEAVLQQKEATMIQRIQRVKIDQNVDISDQELLDHYNANMHLYEENVRVKVQEISLPDSATAQQVYQQASAGQDFTELVRQFSD
ncbi:hypothetical protein EH222_07500, partial [candidate division KSB1 bacterium]